MKYSQFCAHVCMLLTEVEWHSYSHVKHFVQRLSVMVTTCCYCQLTTVVNNVT